MGDVHQELLTHLKLNLASLPDRAVTGEMLEAIAQPFLSEVEKVHATVINKMWKDVILPCGITLFVLILLGVLGWIIQRARHYLLKQFRRWVLRRDPEEEEAEADRVTRIATALETRLPSPSDEPSGETSALGPRAKNRTDRLK